LNKTAAHGVIEMDIGVAIWRRVALRSWIVAGILSLPLTCTAAANWTDLGQVSNLIQQPTTGLGAGMVFVSVSTTVNPSGCSAPNGYYFSVTDDRTTRLFTMLMMAQASGRSVQIYVTGTCHPWGYALLDGVIVQ
jgi:hypothetical protein